MSRSVPLPNRPCPWPGDGGPLQAAFWASLTGHGCPGLDGARPPSVDVMADSGAAVPIVLTDSVPGAAFGNGMASQAAPATWPAGVVPPDGFPSPLAPTLDGPGFGFGQGDPLDTAAPGPVLARLAEDAHTSLGGIDDDCLIGVIRAWRRIASWATGREVAAIAELARRRPADGLPGSGREYVADELAAAL